MARGRPREAWRAREIPQRYALFLSALGLLGLLMVGSGAWLWLASSDSALPAASPTLALASHLTTPTLLNAPTLPPRWTPTPTPLPSDTPTETAIPSATLSPTPAPTRTPQPSATPTPSPTITPLWPTVIPATRAAPPATGSSHPTLEDFWNSRAFWRLELFDVGLPIGESDTLIGPDEQLWSYLHASFASAGIADQWGAPVPFPGCVTLWVSGDRGRYFRPWRPQCLIQCHDRPCAAEADQVEQQQYPRVARADSGLWLMVYEWRAVAVLRTSWDGLNWSRPTAIEGTGQWRSPPLACRPVEVIGLHPFVDPAQEYSCLSGGPPGLYVEGDQLYVFVGLGKNPGRMGCLAGSLAQGVSNLRPCAMDFLFQGSESYGPLDVVGAAANPHFDFRIISSAEVLKVNGRYYMAYEGVRGPSAPGGGDVQFNLGFARSAGPVVDGPWEKYPGNPVLLDVPGNVGVGHADLLVLDGVTYMYTATSNATRGRYVLRWRP